LKQLQFSFSFNNDGSCSGTLIAFTGITGDGLNIYGLVISSTLKSFHAFTTLGCGSQNFNVS
jgi:hypothetical protein